MLRRRQPLGRGSNRAHTLPTPLGGGVAPVPWSVTARDSDSEAAPR